MSIESGDLKSNIILRAGTRKYIEHVINKRVNKYNIVV